MNSLLKGEEFIDFPLDKIKTNFKTYGFEDIGDIEQDYQEIVELAGADSSCSIS